LFSPAEMVYNSGVAGFQVFTGTAQVPLNVACGTFRMRVRCNYSVVNLNPCGTQTFGETEDYNVIVNSVPPTLTTSSTPAGCGLNNGTATVSPSGLFSYQWNTVPVQTTSTATGLATGTYTCIVVPGPGCPPDTITVAVGLNSNLPTYTVNSASICEGDSIVLTATPSQSHQGGDYLWQPGNFTTQSITVSPAATQTYSVTYTFTGCTTTPASGTVTVNSNALVTVNAALPGICLGDSTVFIASGATTFQWIPPLGLSSSSGNMVSASPAVSTNYMVIGTNQSAQCSDTSYVQLAVYDKPILALTLNNAICRNDSVILSASGASIYQWSPSGFAVVWNDSTVTASPQNSTTYTLTGTNLFGCTDSLHVAVTVNSLPLFAMQASANPTCAGDSVTLDAPGSNFSYKFTPGNFTVFPFKVAPVTTTTYIAESTDVNGCASSDTITINVNPLPVVSLALGTNPICIGNSASITASGADNYNWATTPDMVLLSNAMVDVSPIINTQYSVTGLTQAGCFSTETIMVNVHPPLSITVSKDTAVCIGHSYFIQTTASGGNGNYSYVWSPPLGLDNTSQPNVTASPNTTTTYTVTLTDNCTVLSPDASVTVKVDNLPIVTFNPSHSVGCAPVELLLANTTPKSKYCIWDLGNHKISTDCNLAHTYREVGNYQIYLSITDSNDCVNSSSFHTLTVNPIPEADFYYNPEKITISNPMVKFNPSTSSPDVVNWHWNFTAFDSSVMEFPSFQFPYTGQFPVALIVKNIFGCPDTMIQFVLVSEDLKVYIPNAFTPNDDELNDFFGPIGAGINQAGFYMAIYNRWGERIYETNQLSRPWNGRHQKSGTMQSKGIYTYTINLQDLEGINSTFNGTVTLLR
ncbi:MAG: gliding motility-associated C-terminal domain-containing protein, partial [Bacteroidetes bacterium]|nr:gliding motility-associated C-terminal domain-containing protein [Bacteroidota bacterium]